MGIDPTEGVETPHLGNCIIHEAAGYHSNSHNMVRSLMSVRWPVYNGLSEYLRRTGQHLCCASAKNNSPKEDLYSIMATVADAAAVCFLGLSIWSQEKLPLQESLVFVVCFAVDADKNNEYLYGFTTFDWRVLSRVSTLRALCPVLFANK